MRLQISRLPVRIQQKARKNEIRKVFSYFVLAAFCRFLVCVSKAQLHLCRNLLFYWLFFYQIHLLKFPVLYFSPFHFWFDRFGLYDTGLVFY